MIGKFLLVTCLFASSLALPRKLKDMLEVAPTIVNGTDAKIEELPFIVSLQYDYNETHSYHFCGASILSPLWLLTVSS